MEDNLNDLTLVLVSGARGLRGLLAKLSRSDPNIAVNQVEYALVRQKATLDALGLAEYDKTVTMQRITWNLPMAQVVQLWKAAATDRIADLYSPRHAGKHKVLVAYPMYFGGRRHEFYSPLDIPMIEHALPGGARIKGVALLIDDIYEVYHKLTAPGQLFDPADRFPEFVKKEAKAVGVTPDEYVRKAGHSYDQRRLEMLALSWQVSILQQILAWRRMDVALARSLALQFASGRFMAFGLKQLTEALRLWIAGPDPVAYLSHPISQARRLRRSEEWDQIELVSEVNRLQRQMADEHVVLMMPTAIDEFRFGYSKAPEPRLTPRWPLPAAEPELLYRPPEEVDSPEFDNLFNPRAVLDTLKLDTSVHALDRIGTRYNTSDATIKVVAGTLIGMLINAIQDQVGERDNLLVGNCPHLFIYRPYYGTRLEPSSGVRDELEYWLMLEASDGPRAAFLHTPADIAAALNLVRQSDALLAEWRNAVFAWHIRFAAHSLGLLESTARACAGGKDASVVAGSAPTPEDKRRYQAGREQFERKAQLAVLERFLALRDLNEPADRLRNVRVWVTNGPEEQSVAVTSIALFFTGANSHGNLERSWNPEWMAGITSPGLYEPGE